MEHINALIGVGLYTVAEAARLSGVSSGRVRRWLRGYDFKTTGGDVRHSHPVSRSDLAPIDGALALSFHDLLEVRFVAAFLHAGVTWQRLRPAAQAACEILGTRHPFATRRFKTDGRTLFAEIATRLDDRKLLDMTQSQYAFREVIAPTLFTGLEFAADALVRWRPLGARSPVVLDPERAFGQPIVEQSGVPTKVLAAAVKAEGEGSVVRVARWFDVAPRAVDAAVDFEQRLSERRLAA